MKPTDPNSNFIHSAIGTHPAIDPMPYPGSAPETIPFPPAPDPTPDPPVPPSDPPMPVESDPPMPKTAANRMLQGRGFQLETQEEQQSLIQKYSFRTLWR